MSRIKQRAIASLGVAVACSAAIGLSATPASADPCITWHSAPLYQQDTDNDGDYDVYYFYPPVPTDTSPAGCLTSPTSATTGIRIVEFG